MIDADLHARAGLLGSGEHSSNFFWLAWSQLGYDVAATGVSHYGLAMRALWPGQRPIPQALDKFRSGFAAFRRGDRRPSVLA